MNFNILDTLDSGLVISYCCDACPSCDYVLSNSETYLKYIDPMGFNYSCRNNYLFNQFTYEEFLNNCILYKPYDTNTNGEYLLNSWSNNGFEGCIEELRTKIGTTNFENLIGNNKGIIEQERLFSGNGICFILEYAAESGITDQNDIYDLVDMVLTKGLVVKCISNKLLIIASMETFLKIAESLDIINNPVSNPSSNNLC